MHWWEVTMYIHLLTLVSSFWADSFPQIIQSNPTCTCHNKTRPSPRCYLLVSAPRGTGLCKGNWENICGSALITKCDLFLDGPSLSMSDFLLASETCRWSRQSSTHTVHLVMHGHINLLMIPQGEPLWFLSPIALKLYMADSLFPQAPRYQQLNPELIPTWWDVVQPKSLSDCGSVDRGVIAGFGMETNILHCCNG